MNTQRSIITGQIRSPIHSDEPDERDLKKHVKSGWLPDSYPISQYSPRAMNQGQTGACGAFTGWSLIYNITARLLSPVSIDPFRLYDDIRKWRGSYPDDTGMSIRELFKFLHQVGAAIEGVKSRFKIPGYERIPVNASTPMLLKQTIALEKLPVVAGIRISDEQMRSSYFASTGILFDQYQEKHYNHAVMIDGYGSMFHFLNSWGIRWGHGGRGYLPMSFVANDKLMIDLWSLHPEHA